MSTVQPFHCRATNLSEADDGAVLPGPCRSPQSTDHTGVMRPEPLREDGQRVLSITPVYYITINPIPQKDGTNSLFDNIGQLQCRFKDRHQWWWREFRCSLSLSMDKLFPMAIKYVIYH